MVAFVIEPLSSPFLMIDKPCSDSLKLLLPPLIIGEAEVGDAVERIARACARLDVAAPDKEVRA